MSKKRKTAGRPLTAQGTRKIPFTLSVEIDEMLERLAKSGFYGRSKSEVATVLLSREFERIAVDDVLAKLRKVAEDR